MDLSANKEPCPLLASYNVCATTRSLLLNDVVEPFKIKQNKTKK